ncbi:glucosamine-6-phosphate deaminase [Rubripirellula reticaptiva]|uniref:Glucosamine-6-phosphate deaminase n=1 Tax=Rubripirellula reticaptiva TaxID=2528013 RepID=A0A5C6FA67_9BACT|nr:glucosamine-6-phosphate deaminase [Rubripirellula reticaptiva]TWU58278.1 Glucosamine-6-phosphate deaminase 1 [Rubripirellula reticaptiva]
MKNSPKIVTVKTAADVAEYTADVFAAAIKSNPKIVLGLATGSSPIGCYQRLVERSRGGEFSFAQATSFNLDEYIGLDADHPQSFRHFMQSQLFDLIDIRPSNTFVPDGKCPDVAKHVANYELKITEAGGIEIQLLGIGTNGHIAFNEPGSAADSRTREVSLTRQTIESNSRFFPSIADVPTTAITMGIGTILEAKQIVLIATGAGKAKAVAEAIEGPMTIDCPASLLQSHPNVIFVVDQAAGSGLTPKT